MKKSIIKSIVVFSILVFTNVTFSAELKINNQEGHTGDTVTFTVALNGNSSEIKNMEFSILYDSEILNFEGYKAGFLVSDFTLFYTAPLKISKKIIKVAGITSHPIPPNTTGEIVRISFTVRSCGDTKLELSKLLGSVEGFATGNGQFNCNKKQ